MTPTKQKQSSTNRSNSPKQKALSNLPTKPQQSSKHHSKSPKQVRLAALPTKPREVSNSTALMIRVESDEHGFNFGGRRRHCQCFRNCLNLVPATRAQTYPPALIGSLICATILFTTASSITARVLVTLYTCLPSRSPTLADRVRREPTLRNGKSDRRPLAFCAPLVMHLSWERDPENLLVLWSRM